MTLVALARVAPGACAAALVIGGCGSASVARCMKQPRTFSPYALSGSKLTVRRGVIVYAVEGEPEKYLSPSYPSGFPWLSPRSSQPRVLSTVRLCKTTVFTMSIPERVFAFRATGVGRATLLAPLAPAWRSVKRGPPPYGATITVHQ